MEIPTIKFLDENIKPYKLFHFELNVSRRHLLYIDDIEQFYKQIAMHLAEKLIEEKMITFYSNYDEIVRLKVKIYHQSARYDTKLLDICTDCVKSFEKWIGERNENDEQTRVHRPSYGDLDH